LLCALGPSKHALIDAQTAHQPDSVLMDVDEVWSLNAAVNWYAGRVRWDCLFVLDYLDGERSKYPRYVQRIADWASRHQAPVITSLAGAMAEHPYIHEYPIREVINAMGDTSHLYYHNSIPLIVAYALAIGVKQLIIYGADYTHEATKRREDDRANAEYWIGFAAARGMVIQIAPESSLLNANQPERVYGYPYMPVSAQPARQAGVTA
jgi:hypothetical protein